MAEQATGTSDSVPGNWTPEQAARAMAASDGVGNEVTSASIDMLPTGGRTGQITTSTIAACALLAAAIAVPMSVSAISSHAPPASASIHRADGVVPPTAVPLTEQRSMSTNGHPRNGTSGTRTLTSSVPGVASVALAGFATMASSADSTSHRYADFSDARATINVAGTAICDPQHGYTAECRIWIDSIQPTLSPAFPSSIMFQHQNSVDHKWLALDSGRGSGFVVGEARSWFLEKWTETTEPLPVGRWVHLAHVIRDGFDLIYVDGALRISSEDASTDRLNGGAGMHLGAGLMADYARILDSFGGKLDWIRISSTARYGGSGFTVPLEEDLVPDPQTNLLVTFNGTADNAYADLSPHMYPLSPGQGIPGGKVPPIVPDCNDNGIDDRSEIANGAVVDTNSDGYPDICQCNSFPGLPSCCPADIFRDGSVNGADLGALLFYWGPTTSIEASQRCDIDRNGTVDGADLGMLLASWGPCNG